MAKNIVIPANHGERDTFADLSGTTYQIQYGIAVKVVGANRKRCPLMRGKRRVNRGLRRSSIG